MNGNEKNIYPNFIRSTTKQNPWEQIHILLVRKILRTKQLYPSMPQFTTQVIRDIEYDSIPFYYISSLHHGSYSIYGNITTMY